MNEPVHDFMARSTSTSKEEGRLKMFSGKNKKKKRAIVKRLISKKGK